LLRKIIPFETSQTEAVMATPKAGPPQVVFRVGKLKTDSHISAAAAHNLRSRDTPSADPKPGGFIEIVELSKPAKERVREIIGEQTIRTNAVLAVEVIISASASYFRPGQEDRAGFYEPERLQAWREKVEPFIEARFPNAASVVLHLDESTPHYQIIDVPLDENGKLNCRGKYGGKWALSQWQTDAANAVKDLGIERGIEGSLAEHTSIREYYENVNQPLPKIPEVKTQRPEPLPPRSLAENLPFGEAKAKRDEIELSHAALNAKRESEKQAKNEAILGAWEQAQDKANGYELAEKKRISAEATARKLDEEKRLLKIQADKLREIPIKEVLKKVYGAELEKDSRDSHASQKYVLPDGRKIAVSKGADVWIEQGDKGQRGAINLVMHLDGLDYKKAVRLLAESFDSSALAAEHSRTLVRRAASEIKKISTDPVPAPVPDPTRWPRVKKWLHEVRGIPKKLIDKLYEQGLVYADSRGNATFARVNGGAFQRGTGEQKFHRALGGADCGPFLIPGTDKKIVLVEAAIDAIAVKSTMPNATVIASGGDMLPPEKLKNWVPDGSEVFAAHDADTRGETVAKDAAEVLNAKRMKPTEKDWAQTVLREPWRIDASWLDTEADGGGKKALKHS
jgi:hypothetical protein